MNRGEPIDILIVEDNPGDVDLIRQSFKDFKIANDLHEVKDGVEALRYLRRQGPYAWAARPDLILLDLNLPRKNGHEVLAEIKKDPSLRQIPVVILSSSEAAADVAKAYDLHANCYLSKSGNLSEFIKAIQAIKSFGISIVKLPP